MRWFWGAIGSLCLAAAASAAGYDDFAAGLSALNSNNNTAAISYLTAAIKAPDLVPAYLPAAYRQRAIAYLSKKQCQEAISDINASAALTPLDSPGYALRSTVKVCLKDIPGAQADFETAIGPDADAIRYWFFGRDLWEEGFFEDSYKNFVRAIELFDKKDPDGEHARRYITLWYAIVSDRVGRFDSATLAKLADVYLSSKWPYPIVKLYLGKLSPEELPERAASLNPETSKNQMCEVNFYTGQWYLTHNNIEAGKKATAAAVADCPKRYLEYSAAIAEAKRLGLPVPKEETN